MNNKEDKKKLMTSKWRKKMSKLITFWDVVELVYGTRDLEITSHYDESPSVLGIRKFNHTGVDLRTNEGSPIRVPEDAIVRTQVFGVREGGLDYAGPHPYGNSVSIFIPKWGVSIGFAHNEYRQSVVERGQELTKGDYMTNTGDTGLSSGPHSHMMMCFGDHSTLQELIDKSFDPETFSIYVDDNGYIDHAATGGSGEAVDNSQPSDSDFISAIGPIHIPAGSTLYDRNGNAYEIPTTVDNYGDVFETNGTLTGFTAPWLIGVDVAYTKRAGSGTYYVGQTVTIPGGTTLRTSEGVAEEIRTTNPHTVYITAQNGSLLQFSADWLIGRSSSWVHVDDIA